MPIKYSFSNVELKVGGKVVGFMREFTYESGPEVAPRRRRKTREALPASQTHDAITPGPPESTDFHTGKAQADWFDKVWSAKKPKRGGA